MINGIFSSKILDLILKNYDFKNIFTVFLSHLNISLILNLAKSLTKFTKLSVFVV
jgi:hypothetical protein